MHPATSTATPVNEIDISTSLFGDGGTFDPDAPWEGDAFELRNAPRNVRQQGGEDEDEDQDEAFVAATQAAAYRQIDSKRFKKAGAFQTMGLNPHLLNAISRKGFSVPTPIQRKTIPAILAGQDVVGMARTGSGKTAAFVIPMIEKLKSHSAKVGARALVLSPSRELALQTLKVVKELGKGTDLRMTLLVGGDSLEDQFGSMASNPDIIIATPGRFEHLKVEMNLQLSSVRYVVFDEADRLFEMGFAAQLTEILHSLPTTRQTLLISATLPKSLVEFARAGLHDPKLVRLDAESKMAPELQSAFFNVMAGEKEGALLYILQDVIKMPVGATEANKKREQQSQDRNKKRKRGDEAVSGNGTPTPHSTVVFAATKHHVEYLAHLLKACGYATSFVYGSLDQTARKMQTLDFRTGMTNILVVTDVAARGLDIPVLANVINYDFPSQSKIFVHRVGRTARAGKQGWSYSLITKRDLPYLLDLQLFLGRKLVLGRSTREEAMFKHSIVVGTLPRDKVEHCCEDYVKLVDGDDDLVSMRDVASKGEKQYLRTRNAASTESVKRAKQLDQDEGTLGINMLFDADDAVEQERLSMLARLSGFKPNETVFELGKRGTASAVAEVVQKQRKRIAPEPRSQRGNVDSKNACHPDRTYEQASASGYEAVRGSAEDESTGDEELVCTRPGLDMDDASEDELKLTFNAHPQKKNRNPRWIDSEHFMGYTPASINTAEDRAYGVHSGSNTNTDFISAANSAVMNLTNDDSKSFAETSRVRWDSKSKKYVSRANDQDGSKGKKMIRGESGQKIAASFRSGRYDAWRKSNKVGQLPRVGELERNNTSAGRNEAGGRFRHKAEKAPKDADRYRDDYDKRKKRVEEAKEKRIGRFKEGKGRTELRGVDDVRKARAVKQRKREKNARPGRKRI